MLTDLIWIAALVAMFGGALFLTSVILFPRIDDGEWSDDYDHSDIQRRYRNAGHE